MSGFVCDQIRSKNVVNVRAAEIACSWWNWIVLKGVRGVENGMDCYLAFCGWVRLRLRKYSLGAWCRIVDYRVLGVWYDLWVPGTGCHDRHSLLPNLPWAQHGYPSNINFPGLAILTVLINSAGLIVFIHNVARVLISAEVTIILFGCQIHGLVMIICLTTVFRMFLLSFWARG